jgi:hypothetical protein
MPHCTSHPCAHDDLAHERGERLLTRLGAVVAEPGGREDQAYRVSIHVFILDGHAE